MWLSPSLCISYQDSNSNICVLFILSLHCRVLQVQVPLRAALFLRKALKCSEIVFFALASISHMVQALKYIHRLCLCTSLQPYKNNIPALKAFRSFAIQVLSVPRSESITEWDNFRNTKVMSCYKKKKQDDVTKTQFH